MDGTRERVISLNAIYLASKDKNMKIKRILLILTGFLFLSAMVSAQSPSPTPETPKDFWGNLDATTKAVAGVVGLITTILGVPVAFLLIRKTKAEIRKTELEAKQLESNLVSAGGNTESNGHTINISKSSEINIQILTDPRLLNPLLLLLDFIIAFIISLLADYTFEIFFPYPIPRILSIGVAIFLFVPILQEAFRVKKILRSKQTKENEPFADKKDSTENSDKA